MVCFNYQVQTTYDMAKWPFIECIDGIYKKKPICEGDGTPCSNMMKGKAVGKATLGGACGDFYILSDRGEYLFPLNIDSYPDIKQEGATFEFSYTQKADPCNSAPGIIINCLVMTSVK